MYHSLVSALMSIFQQDNTKKRLKKKVKRRGHVSCSALCVGDKFSEVLYIVTLYSTCIHSMYVCVYVYAYICMYIRRYICMCVRTYVYTFVCIYVRICICMHLCIYIRMYVYAYVYIYQTHTQSSDF